MTMQQPQPGAMDQNGFPLDASGNYTLPAALLAQYPALATLSWAQGDVNVEDDPSGRSSFDASGSEYYEEDEGGYVSNDPTSQQQFGEQQYRQQEGRFNGGYSSDIGGR